MTQWRLRGEADMATRAKANYVVDAKGRRTAVILPVKEYERMLQELDDLRDAQYVDEAEATAEGFVEIGDLKRSMKGEAA
jgi:hypothetical protein